MPSDWRRLQSDDPAALCFVIHASVYFVSAVCCSLVAHGNKMASCTKPESYAAVQAKPHFSNFSHEITFGVVGIFSEPIQGAKRNGEHLLCSQPALSKLHSSSAVRGQWLGGCCSSVPAELQQCKQR